jgi:MarR family transcriptional regulator for hemolysin
MICARGTTPRGARMGQHANFAFLLKDISRLYARNFERHATAIGLSLDDCRVLTYLSRNPGISQARLAYLTDTDPMTLGRVLKRMESDALITRRTDPQDRRVRAVALLPPSARILQALRRVATRALDEGLEGIGAADRERLMQLLRLIHANLDTLVPGLAERGTRRRRPQQRRVGGGAGTRTPTAG